MTTSSPGSPASRTPFLSPQALSPTPPSAPEPVLDLDTRGLWRKWRQTINLARVLTHRPRAASVRLRTRLRSLGPIRHPVFILGCPRSGTTFLGEVLAALPGATYYFEPPAMKYYTRLIHEGRVTEAQARRFYHRGFHTLLLAVPGDGPRLIEKNPNHTWVAETLWRIFPDARFVVIHRDGHDTALSLLRKPWHLRASLASGLREPGGYLYGPYPHFYIEPERREEFTQTSDLHRCIWIWRRHAEQLERLRTTLPRFAQHHLDYEDLIRSPEPTLRALLDFIDESSPAAYAAVSEAARAGHDTSIGRGRTTFNSDELALIAREAGPLLTP